MTTESTMTPCMIVVISLGTRLEVEDLVAHVEERPEQGADRHADRVVATQQRDGDAGEAGATREVQAEGVARSRAARACPRGPRSPPDSSMLTRIMRFDVDPLATAADSDLPVARRSKPKRVRLRSTE